MTLFAKTDTPAPVPVVQQVIELLETIVRANRSHQSDKSHPLEFEWTYTWAEVSDYVLRLDEWIECGEESLIVACCLIKKLETIREALPVMSQSTFHKIFSLSFVLAVKMMEDLTLNNADFGKVCCFTTQELNDIEVHMLEQLGFNTTVTEREFADMSAQLQTFVQVKQKHGKSLNSLVQQSTNDTTLSIALATATQIASGLDKRSSKKAMPAEEEEAPFQPPPSLAKKSASRFKLGRSKTRTTNVKAKDDPSTPAGLNSVKARPRSLFSGSGMAKVIASLQLTSGPNTSRGGPEPQAHAVVMLAKQMSL